MRRFWVLLLVVGVVAALGPAAVADTDPRVPGKHQWTRQFGSSPDDEGQGVAVHASGVYVTGRTQGALPGWTNQGGWDVLVRSYDHAGRHRWTRQFGTSAEDWGSGVAVDASGVYVVGHTGGALPGQTHRGGTDVFLRVYNHAGQLQRTHQFGTSESDFAWAVAVHASGVYVVGHTSGTLPGMASQGGEDAFVRSYTHDGKHRWTRQFGTSETDNGHGVAVDASGVYVVGFTGGALLDQTHRGLYDVFVRSYTHDGKHRWTRQFGTSTYDFGRGVAVNASGVYVAGYTYGALPGQAHQGGWDAFVRSYTSDGARRWTRQSGTGATDIARGVAVNASGVYLTGQTNGTFPGHTNYGAEDVFVRSYSHSGQHLWIRQFGTSGVDGGAGIAAGAAAVFVAGYVGGALPGQTHQGESDVFLRKYATE
ncbi:MAG: hypothetical protein FJW79_03815 [Actinobacteria bacterium]|nr:hypothetical protein [Actinomycetota bacterium]